jgi:hypothetical protein
MSRASQRIKLSNRAYLEALQRLPLLLHTLAVVELGYPTRGVRVGVLRSRRDL